MNEYMNPIKSVSANFNNEPLLTIHCDGRVTTSDRLKPEETAALVLDQIKTQWLKDAQATKIRELQDRIKRLKDAQATKIRELQDRIKRLEEALECIREYWNRDNNQRAMVEACWYAIDKSSEALEAKEAKP